MKLNYSVKALFLCLLLPVIGFSQTQTANYYNVNSGNGKGLRFWNGSNSYRIAMGNASEYKYGPVSDYSIKTFMSSNSGRGWTWGITGQTPIAALRNNGTFQIAKDFIAMGKIGIGTNLSRTSVHIFGESPSFRLEEKFYSNHLSWDLRVEDGDFGIYVGTSSTPNFDHTYSTLGKKLELSSGALTVLTNYFNLPNIGFSLNDDYFSYNGNFKVKENGYVYARQMEIIGSGNFPDYVFDADYELKSLEEVEDYIEEHHHLPDVPSAEEIKENGHNLGEMDEILLKKIEELTLYMIELKKENEELKVIVEELRDK